MTFIRPRHLRQLADADYVIVENFLPDSLGRDLVTDIHSLRSEKRFVIADIGHDGGQIQDENTPFRDIRRSETCFLGRRRRKDLGETTPAARERLYTILDDLVEDLDSSITADKGGKLDSELIEVMYAYYPNGGYYRRHVDAEAGTVSSVRRYSFLIYLNKEWVESDGGCLRIHRDDGGDYLPPGSLPNYVDVHPKMGTLVIFKSEKVPHEVLDTHKERCAVVGWFLSSSSSAATADNPTSPIPITRKDLIEPNTLQALRQFRDCVPSLKTKLQPTVPSNYQSGMLGDDFSFPGFETKQENIPSVPDTDPQYWQKIATFHSSGTIATLSLGGTRLHRIGEGTSVLLPPLLTATTLDLAATDIPLVILCEWVGGCDGLKELHLGGNALGDDGIISLCRDCSQTLSQLRTLDLRYNDISCRGIKGLCDLILGRKEGSSLELLFLEGNALGDDGVTTCFSDSTFGLMELYLGQNGIGPEGAKALSRGISRGRSRLKKLYMEGNRIGEGGAAAFCEVLTDMGDDDKVLEKLYVDNNGLGKEASLALAKALNSATQIGDGGICQ